MPGNENGNTRKNKNGKKIKLADHRKREGHNERNLQYGTTASNVCDTK